MDIVWLHWLPGASWPSVPASTREVFFGTAHKVLRGGAWATRARVISPAFRNWDFPSGAEIFAGFRIASDA